jgi:hypothetical protein
LGLAIGLELGLDGVKITWAEMGQAHSFSFFSSFTPRTQEILLGTQGLFRLFISSSFLFSTLLDPLSSFFACFFPFLFLLVLSDLLLFFFSTVRVSSSMISPLYFLYFLFLPSERAWARVWGSAATHGQRRGGGAGHVRRRRRRQGSSSSVGDAGSVVAGQRSTRGQGGSGSRRTAGHGWALATAPTQFDGCTGFFSWKSGQQLWWIGKDDAAV